MSVIRVVSVRGLRTPEQRAGVVYVGRTVRSAGWVGHPLGNPFRPINPGRQDYYEDRGEVDPAIVNCLAKYRGWLAGKDRVDLRVLLTTLWEDTHHGQLPLGCWCVDAEVTTTDDPNGFVCHAQVLAAELHRRFLTPIAADHLATLRAEVLRLRTEDREPWTEYTGPSPACCVCHKPATGHYDDRPDCPSCGRVECELRMQAGLDGMDERG